MKKPSAEIRQELILCELAAILDRYIRNGTLTWGGNISPTAKFFVEIALLIPEFQQFGFDERRKWFGFPR